MLSVTYAAPDDVGAIAAVLDELDRYYGASNVTSLDQRIAEIHAAVFSDPVAARVLLARDSGELAGLAAYSFLWPAVGSTRSLYLKELYVVKASRRRGVGKALMRRVCEIAVENECSRVEWTADADNPDALGFYEALGISVNPAKKFYRVEGHALIAASETLA
jgi:ribosomal protein S18 acetylase RimI-like enzyme